MEIGLVAKDRATRQVDRFGWSTWMTNPRGAGQTLVDLGAGTSFTGFGVMWL